MTRIIILSLSVLLSASACNSRVREKELEKKIAELDEREQELLLKERTLDLREQELDKRSVRIDSLVASDTALIKVGTESSTDSLLINRAIIGNWLVNMICTHTTCPGSAIGDTKTENWELSYQGNHVVAKAIDHGRLVRVYSGLLNGNRMELIEHRDTSALLYDTRMVVRLNILDAKSIEGQREIIREDECRIVYTVQMNKQ